ncbi:hypothetical protein [Sphingomonas sp. CCH18-H6]|uniref:hypothetical protein n=2 Tax=Sphingomonas TaxID=13687 RepID=UPI00082E6378|nr:hypothetical protein [Sphingomonas sp. CCH18-H6]
MTVDGIAGAGATPSRSWATTDHAHAWVDQWRDGAGFDVAALARAMIWDGVDEAALASIEAAMTPVERGELAAAMDAAADRPRATGTGAGPADGNASGAGDAGFDAFATSLTTTDQRIVVRRVEAMPGTLDPSRPPAAGAHADAAAADTAPPATDGDTASATPAVAPRAIEILPPLPPGADLPAPVTSRSD